MPTDLTEGQFDSRSYATLSVVPSIDIPRGESAVVTLRLGATLDESNRHSGVVSPLLGATWRKATSDGSRYLTMEYAGTSQLPGYTVLNSRPTGLFGGNPDLGREKSKQVSLSAGQLAARECPVDQVIVPTQEDRQGSIPIRGQLAG